MKKRLSAFLLALVWAFALSACDIPAASSQPPVPVSDPSLPVVEESTAAPESALDDAEPSTEPDSGLDETEPSAEPDSSPAETEVSASQAPEGAQSAAPAVNEDGWYDSKEDVALYIHLYGHLPDNYVTKRKAQDQGWTGGSVEPYTGEGTAIGGSRFGNYEGLLPEAHGRTYTECDIGTVGGSSRGAKRIVFSNDGLIYYTEDHYESFELLYGEP